MYLCIVPTRDRMPGGISSEDFPSWARSAFVLNAVVLSLSHGEVPSHRRSAFPSISQELSRNANRESGTPVTVNSPTVKCPMVRLQRYSTLQKPILGYQQVGSDRVALIKPSCPCVGQCSCPTNRGQSITATDSAILGMLYSSRALTDPTSSQKRTTRHTSNCACNLRKTNHTECVF